MSDLVSGPLATLGVVDLSTTLTGTQVSQLFADFGAEVVQVEPPRGSPLRTQAAFPFWGRGKKSIELDLHDPADADVVRALALGADVIVETWRPGVAERFGLGYEALAVQNPRLVYTSVTGFGRIGPYAHLKGYEGVVMAKLGAFDALSSLTVRPGPSFASVPYCSFSASLTALCGTLAALYERDRSGVGQKVETTLVQGIAAHDTWNWMVRLVAARHSDAFTAVPRVDAGRRVPNGPLSYRLLVALTKDGRWLQFSQTSERLWIAFMRALGLDWMLTDRDWKDAASSEDIDKREALWERMLAAVRGRTVAEWQEIFDGDPDVFAEIFRHGTELLHHPQVLHDGQVVEITDPKVGSVRQPGPLVKMATPAGPDRPAPGLDEHGAELRSRARPARAGEVPTDSPVDPALLGVTVIELGTYYAAPYGATILTDFGARVIKVEQLDGDPMRWIVPFPEVGAVKVLQGKQSVAVDIGTAAGHEIVYELVRRADLVLRSFRGGVAERLGYDDKTLLSINPNLVYLNAPGYGVDGPYGHRPAYAPTIGAGAGMARRNLGATVAERDDLTDDEVKDASLRMATAAMAVGHADGFASLGVATGLLLGLVARRLGMPGQSMLMTMLNTLAHTLSEDMVEYKGRAAAPTADPDLLGLGALYRLYETAEGWVFLAAPQEKEWHRLVVALRRYGDLGADNRFVTSEARRADDAALAAALGAILRKRSARQWEGELAAADVACVVVETGPTEAVLMEGESCLGRAMGIVVEVEHPVLGSHPRLMPPAALSRSVGVTGSAPRCGQHTDAVLRELGYTESRIADLRVRGIIGG